MEKRVLLLRAARNDDKRKSFYFIFFLKRAEKHAELERHRLWGQNCTRTTHLLL